MSESTNKTEWIEMDCTVGEGFRVISSSRANSPALLESWRRERDTTARAQALRLGESPAATYITITWNYVTTGRVTVTLTATQAGSSAWGWVRVDSSSIWSLLWRPVTKYPSKEAATLTTTWISNPSPKIYVYVELTQTQLIFNPRPR